VNSPDSSDGGVAWGFPEGTGAVAVDFSFWLENTWSNSSSNPEGAGGAACGDGSALGAAGLGRRSVVSAAAGAGDVGWLPARIRSVLNIAVISEPVSGKDGGWAGLGGGAGALPDAGNFQWPTRDKGSGSDPAAAALA
jgi:hypothetical protein